MCKNCIHRTVCNIKSNIDTEYYAYMGVSFNTKECKSYSGWIPCSERLPEKNDRYMTTSKLKREEESFDLWYENGIWLLDDEDDEFEGTVLAWMPLPEPYKTEKGV